MKKYYVPLMMMLLVLPLIYIGCRDRIERDMSGYELTNVNTNPTTPYHCTDGILDSGEVDIDCGGACPACVQVTPSCTIGGDSIIYTTSPSGYGNSDKISSITVGYNNVSGKFEFSGSCPWTGDNVLIGIVGNNPSVTHSYSITSAQASVLIYDSWLGSYVSLSDGTVYVTKNGSGKYMATVCSGIDYSYWISSQSNYYNFYFTMNITQP